MEYIWCHCPSSGSKRVLPFFFCLTIKRIKYLHHFLKKPTKGSKEPEKNLQNDAITVTKAWDLRAQQVIGGDGKTDWRRTRSLSQLYYICPRRICGFKVKKKKTRNKELPDFPAVDTFGFGFYVTFWMGGKRAHAGSLLWNLSRWCLQEAEGDEKEGKEQRSCQEEQEKADREGWPTSPGLSLTCTHARTHACTHANTRAPSIWLAVCVCIV